MKLVVGLSLGVLINCVCLVISPDTSLFISAVIGASSIAITLGIYDLIEKRK